MDKERAMKNVFEGSASWHDDVVEDINHTGLRKLRKMQSKKEWAAVMRGQGSSKAIVPWGKVITI